MTAVSGMHGVLVDVMTAPETGESRTIATVLNYAEFVGTDQAQCRNFCRELHSSLARYMRSEAAAIVRRVTWTA